jgi:Zn-dependent protease with chaperone function
MTWPTICDPAFSVRLCVTLLHSIWQVALAAALARGLPRLRRRRSVESSYAWHVAALLAALAALPVTYALVPIDRPIAAGQGGGAIDPPSLAAALASGRKMTLPLSNRSAPATNTADVSPGTEALAPATLPPLAEGPSAVWLRVAPWAAWLYAAGVWLMLVRLVRGMWHAHRLGYRAFPIGDGALAETLNSLARHWSMRIVPALARAEEILVPKVVGLLRPTILLPAAAIAGLPPDELEMILAHELAHVRRYDMWVNLAQRAAEVALFFNPALWYLSRRVSTLREYCCDELTCRAAPGSEGELRARYASALVRIVELGREAAADRVPARRFAAGDVAALAAAGRSPSELRRRVARLFGEPLPEPLRLSRGGLLTLGLLAAALLTAPTAWHSATGMAPARTADPAEKKAAGTSDTGSPSPGETYRSSQKGSAQGTQVSGRPDWGDEVAVIVARHVLLWEGKEIVTWAELEKRIAALPDPSRASPDFYFTRGAADLDVQKKANQEISRLRQKFKFIGTSTGGMGGFGPRPDNWYDAIETAKDLTSGEHAARQGKPSPAPAGTAKPPAGGEPSARGREAPHGAAPRIVATSPPVGAVEVDPATPEIAVTFDRDMERGFSWTGGGPEFPPTPDGKTAFWRNPRTCVLPVVLQRGRYYRVGIQSDSYQNFRSAEGLPVRPSAIYFTTRGAGEELKKGLSPPRIVSLRPPNGARDVDPALPEIRVTFDVPMGEGFSWTGGGPEFPDTPEGKAPFWTEDRKTCVLPVALQPGRQYRLGLNSPSFANFQSAHGVALEPVEYTFRTRK